MSPEATKLFNTLQQSPLPLAAEVMRNYFFFQRSYYKMFNSFQLYADENIDRKEERILTSKEKLADYEYVFVYSTENIMIGYTYYFCSISNREHTARGPYQLKESAANNSHLSKYLIALPCDQISLQAPRHSQIMQQYSSSTDEGCDLDHGDLDDPIQLSLPLSVQRLNSYASSTSSSGVITNYHSKSLSQNLSCESSRSNFSTFESFDLNLSDCADLAASLPSCAISSTTTAADNMADSGE